METAEKKNLFAATMEMQNETLSKLIETGKKVTEMYKEHNPINYLMEITKVDNNSLLNPVDVKGNMVKSATIFSKQVRTFSKYQRERMSLFTKTQTEWLQNSELKMNHVWVEKFVEMNDMLEKTYAELDETMWNSLHHGFEVFIKQMEENTLIKEN